ncbi:amino acid adenylation domain-containing protein (plasmid) [Streptomyces californicus]|uniref:Amino acid adenylation domain-containing protein n=1 Tax=Streptomyces californicus TaxID=67351 RepID=A0ABD7D6K2_9ACTN|nr:non-ribosomal peptide synthetase [Streptomyces californicus]QRV39110.1 amino acid adenylation domain-containing protein [Streptomyces californicus]QRV52563.1 amino acid adenylation domain-containing protein [Streptomyces californicus]
MTAERAGASERGERTGTPAYLVRRTGAAGQVEGVEVSVERADMTAGRADGARAPSMSLLEAFLVQADRTPRATALVIGDTVLRYRELADASAGLAARLRACGARPGTTVCLRLEQSAVAVVAVLAALRVGAAWAALEPDLPEARLRALMHDTDCAVVISDRDDRALARLPDAPPLLAAEDLNLTALAEAGARTPASAAPPVPENAPAYLVYTSGSSGPPKGVVVTRRQLADSVRPRGAVYGTAPSVFLMAMRLSFDGMLAGMFWSFSHGHTLLLPTARELRLAPEFTRLAHRHHATHLIAVPSYYRLLLAGSERLPDSLRVVVVAGEVCTSDLVRTHRARLPDARLVNEYGPTETVVSCTVESRLDPDAERVPIGHPWPGATARVLDDRLREVRPGEKGELYVGGAFVALGYARAPGLTAERFVASPFGPAGARLYRTGDIAHRDATGALHYHGRTDQQVKIRGTRVELGDIESALEAHPAVDQAVVTCTRPEDGEPVLTAFLTAVPDRTVPDPRELRRHCRFHLVEQALPHRFVALERMLLTTTGKADRRSLAALVPASREPVSGSAEEDKDRRELTTPPAAAPRPGTKDKPSAFRRTVREIWAEVLGHEDAGPYDNFFGVGGNSLKVIELYSALKERWPGTVRVGELFDLTTIATQAAALEERTVNTGDAGILPPPPARPAPVAYEL